MIVLDSDYMSLLQWSKGTNRMPFLQRVRSLEAENLATTIVTYEDVTYEEQTPPALIMGSSISFRKAGIDVP